MLRLSAWVSPIGQSSVPAGWPRSSKSTFGGAGAPNGAAVTRRTDAPPTVGEPSAVSSSAL